MSPFRVRLLKAPEAAASPRGELRRFTPWSGGLPSRIARLLSKTGRQGAAAAAR